MSTDDQYPGRYAVVAWDAYYPAGGEDDIKAQVGTRAEAEQIAATLRKHDETYVLDLLELASARMEVGE